MLDQPFYDDVHRWTFATRTPMHRVAGGQISSHQLNYRRLIRGAHRFVVDDSMLAHLVHLSNTPDLSQFAYWSLLARLPYDVMWVEWDQHARLRIAQSMEKLSEPFDPSEVSQATGMLLVRDLNSVAKWTMQMFARGNEGDVFTNPVTFVFDPDGTKVDPTGKHMLDMDHVEFDSVTAMGQPPLSEVLALNKGVEFASLGFMNPDRTYGAPDWAINRVGAIEEPIWRLFRKERERHSTSRAKIQEAYVEQLIENRGILRTMIALLATINNVPKIIHNVPARKGYRPAGANRVHYLDQHTITLTLPKTRHLEYIQQRLRLGYGRYRRHDVRGFYRRVTNDRLGVRCHHIPTADSTSEHIMCGRCGSQIRWVNEFQRGDASLGHVQKSYRLRAPSC